MKNEKLSLDFQILRDQCTIIQRDFNTYDALFFSDFSGELLTKTARIFFTDLSEIMQRDWILQVCKIMDPATTQRKGAILENISFKLINKQLLEEKICSEEILLLTNSILAYGEKITPARNKRLTHLDREAHINEILLGDTNTLEIHIFLNNIQEYCDAVGNALGIGPLDFSVSDCPGDVHDLLTVLEKAIKET